MSDSFVGYHGTCPDCSEKILTTREFTYRPCEEAWLGDGIYFFQDDILQAKNFCELARRYKEYVVLESIIISDKVLDFLLIENYNLFEQTARKVGHRYLKIKSGQRRENINAVVINALHSLKPFEVVRAPFQVPKREPAERTNIFPIQIQICVRTKSCITTIEEVYRT